MGKIEFKKLPSATLVETIVALVLIMLIFGIATTILIQTNKSSFSSKKIKADHFIDQYAAETDVEKSFFDDQKEVSSFTVQKKIEENKSGQKVVFIKFSVVDYNGKLITYQNRIFRSK